ncbi:MAG: N-6 DNA methylase [Candidatus Nanoarchaeia archaeon]|nr:N-6 DNA methylase [Candidatus Nanoarchaeia archaeon]
MISKKEAKSRIMELVEHFKKDLESDRANKYSEEETKVRYIQPLFEALGWDFSAKADDISLEERISGKRVDYGFRINGIPKFYVEAKKVKEDLNKIEFAEQAINYAWHKGCTWAVLVDFEGLKIFNSEWKYKGDPSVNKFKEFQYWEYVDRFEELWLLSKESMSRNELDKEAEKVGKKIKKESVGKQILKDLLNWRTLLSKDIIKQNPKKFDINSTELDEVVQRILDRLIFIRTIEDRRIYPDIQLIELVREYESRKKGKIVKKLNILFNEYDDVFNSKLFLKGHFSEQLEISNEVLIEIIKGLYKTKDESIYYDFSAINSDVLGSVYEQYLGYLLKKTAKRAKVEKSKTKRKEQGIYYTPNYIVDYIVKNTVGEYIKGKNKNTVEKIKILDPACGSGSFLIRAFDEVNDYWKRNLKHNISNNLSKKKEKKEASELYGQAKLNFDADVSITKKIEILKNNIHGVDLDEQAVEIARLNLLIKAAEKKHLLPTLDQNIKNGNSLIDDPSVAGNKAFKWEEEFEAIMKEGGFDVIIGNPPYVNIYLLSKNTSEINHYQRFYESAYKKFDLYVLFIEKSIKLLKNGGMMGFIIPDKFLSQPYGEKLRKLILNECSIVEIIDYTDYKIFEQATVDNIILLLKKENLKNIRDNNSINILKPLSNNQTFSTKKISQSFFLDDPQNLFRLNISPEKNNLKDKILHNSILVRDILYVNWGARSGDIKKFVIKEKINDLCKPMLDGRDIGRYSIDYDNKYLIYDEKKLYNPMFKELFENEKIMIRDVNAKEGLKATFDNKNYYAEHTLSICLPFNKLASIKRRGLNFSEYQVKKSEEFDLKYILGILNSNLITFFFKTFIGCGLHVYPDNIRALPIKKMSINEQSSLIKLVEKMILYKERYYEIKNKNTDEKMKLETQIKKLDDEINELVYKIYDITEEEKKIIEGSLNE